MFGRGALQQSRTGDLRAALGAGWQLHAHCADQMEARADRDLARSAVPANRLARDGTHPAALVHARGTVARDRQPRIPRTSLAFEKIDHLVGDQPARADPAQVQHSHGRARVFAYRVRAPALAGGSRALSRGAARYWATTRLVSFCGSASSAALGPE